MAAAGFEVKIDSRQMGQLYADLRKMGSALTVELRRGVRDAAKPVANAVKAAAPSGRIAGAIKTKASFSARNPSVTVVADSRIAPEAAPINNKGRSGTFRHPVFGHDTWVNQKADPFMNAAYGQASNAQRAILAVMDDVARKAGFR